MDGDPKQLALEVWKTLGDSRDAGLTEADSPLVGRLVRSIGLPDPARGPIAIVVPTATAGAAISLEGSAEAGYRVTRADSELAPVVIETRMGDLIVDGDDPLARAQRSIAALEKI
jgi:hypothetical protein